MNSVDEFDFGVNFTNDFHKDKALNINNVLFINFILLRTLLLRPRLL